MLYISSYSSYNIYNCFRVHYNKRRSHLRVSDHYDDNDDDSTSDDDDSVSPVCEYYSYHYCSA